MKLSKRFAVGVLALALSTGILSASPALANDDTGVGMTEVVTTDTNESSVDARSTEEAVTNETEGLPEDTVAPDQDEAAEAPERDERSGNELQRNSARDGERVTSSAPVEAALQQGNRTMGGKVTFPAGTTTTQKESLLIALGGPGSAQYKRGSKDFSYNASTGVWKISKLPAGEFAVTVFLTTPEIPGASVQWVTLSEHKVNLTSTSVANVNTKAGNVGSIAFNVIKLKETSEIKVFFERSGEKNTLNPGWLGSSVAGGHSVPYGGTVNGGSHTLRFELSNGRSGYYDGTRTATADKSRAKAVNIKRFSAHWLGDISVTKIEKMLPAGQMFADVPVKHKFAQEIGWMSKTGLSNGVSVGGQKMYQPKANVTREAMAAFLYRLNTPKGANAPKGYKIPTTSPFADVPTKHKFFKEIAWMYASGISTGNRQATGKPTYAPKSSVSREAMAAFLYRMESPKSYKALKSSPFADVSTKHKFYRQISWMYTTKLSTGTRQPQGKPTYAPGASVSREAMAAFLYRSQN